MIAREWKQNFLVDCGIEHAGNRRADDQIKSNVEKIERGTTDRRDNFLSEVFFLVHFFVQMNDLFGGNNRKDGVSFARDFGKSWLVDMLSAHTRKGWLFSQRRQYWPV